MNRLCSILILLLTFSSCNSNKKQHIEGNVSIIDSVKKSTPIVKKEPVILSKIDSVSLAEIKQYTEEPKNSIFDYYAIEKIDEYSIWSDKMFGRCCTEADLSYSELLKYEITANVNNNKYPHSNLSDFSYQSAYVFKENENTYRLFILYTWTPFFGFLWVFFERNRRKRTDSKRW